MSRCDYCVYRFSWDCDDGYNRVSNSCMCDDFKLDFDCLNDKQKWAIQKILIAESGDQTE